MKTEKLRRTGSRHADAERHVREWLRSQAAGGYVTYDSETNRYSLTEEQVALLADESSPAFVPGIVQVATSGETGR